MRTFLSKAFLAFEITTVATSPPTPPSDVEAQREKSKIALSPCP